MIFVAVDIGGTFTDLIGFDEEAGAFLQAKSLTTPAELTQGVIDCLKQSGVKAGTIALGNWTPLLSAAAFGPPELVNALLDAGADANARDVRGMTPLMLAVATDRQNADVVRALIAKGADVNAKSLAGETALDWARKIGAKPSIDALQRAGAQETRAAAAAVPPPAPAELKASVARSVALLEKTG